MKRRGKTIALLTVAVGLAVLVAAGIAARDRIHKWYEGQFGNGIVDNQIRVIMSRDPTTKTTVRKVRDYPAARDDEELKQIIDKLAEGYAKVGNTTWPFVIDAASDVPWQDVVHLMDLCKRSGIERIEFATPQLH
jgi:hypothetical protein